MIRDRTLEARRKLVSKLPITDEILRGSLLKCVVRHSKVCVLTVSYPGGRTRQFSVRRERVPEMRQWLSNYRELKAAIEAICELNHHLLRPDEAAPKRRRKRT